MEKGMSSHPSSEPTYEVFLNFRGKDTRHTFTDFLYSDMVGAGINVFRDSESLHVGQKIGELLQAIENSRIYIPIFSTNYASSCWCLRELAHMVKCTLKPNGNKEIWPIFLGVEPDDVGLKTNWYDRNLSKRQKTSSSSEEESWKTALIEVAKIRGWTWKEDESQVDLIQSIIRTVVAKLNLRSKKRYTEDLVGVDDQVKEIIGKLDVGSDDVRFLGIHGMAGIGKTTLAKVVFNQLSAHFRDSHFLSNVRKESSQLHGLKDLQKQLLFKFSHSSYISDQIHNVDDGINMIDKVLRNKKVLIVLDDVDKKEQLKSLAGKVSWFGSGSRIIITTRDQSVLTIGREVTNEGSGEKSANVLTHEVREMEFDCALKLFSRHAFSRDSPPDPYASISEAIVTTLGRLPLALEVMGASLSSKPEAFWVGTWHKLKEVLPTKVEEKLKITYDMLDYSQQQVFLDVACFFVDEDKTYPCYMWDACGYYSDDALEVLSLRSFLKINDDNTFWMHDLMRDLGRKIVRDENFEDPCGRSRVWNREEAFNILELKKGSQSIKALSRAYDLQDINLNLAAFPKLRFFRNYGVSLVGDFNNPLSSLIWLSCQNSFPNFMPDNFHPPNLVILDLSNCGFSKEGIGWIKAATKLKVLNLNRCPNLTRIPDLSTLMSLEILDLEGCERLVEIDPSIGELKLLTTLNLRGCSSLRELPEGIGCPHASTKVDMPQMIHLFRWQQMYGNLKSLLMLDLSGTQISKLPHSIGGMVNMMVLRLCGCQNIEDLPDWIWNLLSLVELDLSGTCISQLSDSIVNLKQLTILRMRRMRKITKLPSSIWLLEKLEVLDTKGCEKLAREIPKDIEKLSCLRILDLSGTQISGLPTTVSRLSNLQELHLYHCRELRQLPELPPSLTRLTWGRDWPCSDYDHPTSNPSVDSLNDLLTSIPSPVGVSALPTSISTLTQLEFLSLNTIYVPFLPRLPSSLRELQLEYVVTTQSPDFSNLKNLSTLDLQNCSVLESSGTSDAELEELEICSCNFIRLDALFHLEMKGLTSLTLIRCEFCQEDFDLSHMKKLQEVWLENCKLLVEIRGLEELRSLSSLWVCRCSSIERMSNLSKLRKLRELTVAECPKLRSVEGVNHLKSLKRLRIYQCESLEYLADTSNLDLICLKIEGCEKLPHRPTYCKPGRCAGCSEFSIFEISSKTNTLHRKGSRSNIRLLCLAEEKVISRANVGDERGSVV